VRYVDQSGVYMLADLIADVEEDGTEIYIAELHPEPKDLLARLGVAPGAVPAERIFESAEDAVLAATRGEKMRLEAEAPGAAAVCA
jgi:SulP family sulfate permease